MHITKRYIILSNAIAVFIFSAIIIFVTNNSRAADFDIQLSRIDSNRANSSFEEIVKICRALSIEIKSNLNKIINTGKINRENNILIQNTIMNSFILSLNNCDKSSIFVFLDEKLNHEDRLYFKLYVLL